MPTTFRPYQPDQLLLLSPDLLEWLAPGHLAHHVSDLVDALVLNTFCAPYEGDGRRNAPYEPSMMVKVLLYAYATGVFSSRAIARKLEEDCEGHHDVVFAQRSLGTHAGCEWVGTPIGKLPTPFGRNAVARKGFIGGLLEGHAREDRPVRAAVHPPLPSFESIVENTASRD